MENLFGIKVGDEGTASGCPSDQEGLMRYNSTTKQIEYCDGSEWKTAIGGGAGGNFGGLYQKEKYYGICIEVNHFTGDCSCPVGFNDSVASWVEMNDWPYYAIHQCWR